MRVNYVIVFVSDMKRSVGFYRDTLGLPLRFESPEWSEFATEGATVALHAAATQAVVADATSPSQPGRCRPGFSVPNLDDFHNAMLERGVRCIEEPRDVFGARLAQYADPDGLPLSVSEDAGRG